MACGRWCDGGRPSGRGGRVRLGPRRARRAGAGGRRRRGSRAQRQHAVGGAAVGVGKERVVAHPSGERALRETTHEDAVEVEPEAERDVAHEDALAEATHAPEVGVELQLERAAEHVEARGRLDRVEPGQALERGLDLVGGLLLRLRPRAAAQVVGEEVADEPPCPPREIAPTHTGLRPRRQPLAELGDERRRARAPNRARARTSRGAVRGRAPRAPSPAPLPRRRHGARDARATASHRGRRRHAG